MARRHALLFQPQRHKVTIDFHIAIQGCIVPCIASGLAALSVGAFGITLLQLRKHALRFPAESKGDVDGMQAEIAHHADLTAGGGLAFPVGGLGGVEIAAVQKTSPHLEHTAQRAGLHILKRTLCAGSKREFRTASHKPPAGFSGLTNTPGGGEVDAKGFLGEQILACREHIAIQRLMQMMWHGDIDRIHIVPGKQSAMILRAQLYGGHLGKPLQQLLTQIAHRNELGAHGEIFQRKPTPETSRRLPPHQAATNDPDA